MKSPNRNQREGEGDSPESRMEVAGISIFKRKEKKADEPEDKTQR
jgi:hypothetical protein